MYKTSVTFENFEGEKVTKDLYFNLTKAQITKLQLSYKQGFDKYVDEIIFVGLPWELEEANKYFGDGMLIDGYSI